MGTEGLQPLNPVQPLAQNDAGGIFRRSRCDFNALTGGEFGGEWMHVRCTETIHRGSPDGSAGKESTDNAGDMDSISGSGRSPGEENGNPLQCSCLKNPMHRGATFQRVAKSQTRLSD